MLLYDYMITFDQEISLFWHKRFTGASFLFFFGRYLSIVEVIRNSLDTFIPLQVSLHSMLFLL